MKVQYLKSRKTAGKSYRKRAFRSNRRSIEKERNKLVLPFKKIICEVKSGFMFTVTLAFISAIMITVIKFYREESMFILREVICEGNTLLSRNELFDLLNLELGVQLADVSEEKVKARLLNHPWIEEVNIKKRFPSQLKVVLKEKRAVALCYLAGEKHWFGLDQNGDMLPGLPDKNGDFPVLEKAGDLKNSQLKSIGAFLRDAENSFPGIYNTMSQIKAGNQDEISIFSRDGKFRFRVSLEEDSRATLEMWKLLIKQKYKEISKGGTVDLRVRGYAYVS